MPRAPTSITTTPLQRLAQRGSKLDTPKALPGEGAAGALPPKQQQQQLIQHMGEMRTRISHSRQRDIEESEPWIPIETFYDADTPEAFDLLSALFNKDRGAFSPQEDAAIGNCTFFDSTTAQKQAQPQEAAQQRRQHCDDIVFASDIVSYLSSICRSQQQNEQSAAAAAASGPLSYAALHRLPLDQQVFRIMKQLHLASHATVKRLLAIPTEEQQLLQQLLQQCSQVQGNWCLKSSLACSSTYEATCRDLLLALLIRDAQQQQNGTGIAKEAFRAATRLPPETTDELLTQVAVCASSSWRLKLPPDEAFLSAHPKVAAHFAAFWENRLKEVVKEVHAKREAAESQANGRSTGATTPAQLQLAARGVKAILCEFGGLSLTEIRDKLVETSDELKTLTDDELKHVLRGIALHVQGIWVLNSLGNPQIDEFRSALIRVFSSSSPPKTKSQIIQAIEADLQRRVSLPDFALRKLLREFAKNENGMWIFKGNNSQDAVTGVLALTA
ncbi:SIN-like domain-containing protein [Cyclospora cayetanensis]|uniref:SIN-like domain-containing protein n=1 Tax=Cyclospora cayetanensis TaxID=88456 RepID=A0A1D3CXP1_9EIME|nr:SIN-like domain-containing protein [Cyclospora cayetanensis]